MKKLFGGINLTWKRLIIFAVLIGIYTGVMAMIPITKDTSLRDISISFEVWVLFGIFIIMNSTSAKDSALKCFVFFLISQPIVYLVQVPFSDLGWQILSYYRNWIIWTILTIPMGFIGYFMKKDKLWGILILLPILGLLGSHYSNFLGETLYYFPHHLLSCVFCFVTILLYPLCIFNNKKVRIIGFILSAFIIVISSIYTLQNRITYNTTLLVSNGESKVVFDDTYKAYFEGNDLGNLYIKYNEGIEDYMLDVEFKKAGKTTLILEDANGNKTEFSLNARRSDYDIKKKN